MITIGDIVAHDLQAAIAMSQLHNALAGLGHAYRDPAEILAHLEHYANHTPRCLGATVFYGRLSGFRPTAAPAASSSAPATR